MTEVREETKFIAKGRCPLSQEGYCDYTDESGEQKTKEDAERIVTANLLYHLKNAYGRSGIDEIHAIPVTDFFVETLKINRTIIDREEGA